MKIRTDFVTNSSSSSYLTFLFETKDKREFQCIRNDPEAGHFGGGISEYPFTLEKALRTKTGKDVLEVINKAYSDLVRSAGLENGLFDDLAVQKASITQSVLEALPAEDIKKITINEEVDFGEGESKGTLVLDLQDKTELVEYEIWSDGETEKHKELRHLLTGETEVLLDETEEDEEDEED